MPLDGDLRRANGRGRNVSASGKPREGATCDTLPKLNVEIPEQIAKPFGRAPDGVECRHHDGAAVGPRRNAIAGIGNPTIALFDLAAGKPALQLEAKEKLNGVMWGVAHHPSGFWIGLAGGGGGGWLYFFQGDAANEFFKLKLPNDGRDLALSPDKRQLAVAHADSTLRVFTF